MSKVQEGIDFVATHDAARPCVSEKHIEAEFLAAFKSGAAILGAPITATLKRSDDSGQIVETVDRSKLWEAQTPQVFRRDLLMTAYAANAVKLATDDAAFVEALGHKVQLVEGSPLNIQIT